MRRSREINPALPIIFYGGVGGLVTGSCCRVGDQFIVDYGMFQGRREERSSQGDRRNFRRPADIFNGVPDLLVTHSHIDHTGRIPMLGRAGLAPRIIATEETAPFMKIMLCNSAQIQESGVPGNKLYGVGDVIETLRHLETVPSRSEIAIGQKDSRSSAIFVPNGHVLGANSILVQDGHRNILFTGDIGKPHQSLCGGYLDQPSYPNDPVHVLVVESTNANAEPVSFEEKEASFIRAIQHTWKNGGNPLLPVLSFHRLQEIMEMLTHNQRNGQIPSDCEIIIDAPLGMTVLKAIKQLPPGQLSNRYGDNPEYYRTEKESQDRFNLRHTTVVHSHKQSVGYDLRYADYPGKVIILAGGGMGENGRVVNYLQGNFGRNPKNTVLFTCHQVEGTKGETLVQAEKVSRGQSKKGAKVVKIDGFTSHGSGPEIFDYLGQFDLSRLETVFITHGNNRARFALAQEFRRRGSEKVILPELYQRFSL